MKVFPKKVVMEKFEGFLNIFKPEGMTSADVVRVVKRELKAKKVGYIGTLDPLATGVLPVGIGRATRLFPFLEKQDKVYEAVLKLGEATDTQDKSGKVTESADTSGLTEQAVREAVMSFAGGITQIPPMFSAKKIQGERLYDLARQGITVDRKPINAVVSDLSVISVDLPHVRFVARVTAGAYIRTLCHDIGDKLGVHGHLSELTRLRSGHFSADSAMPLEKVKSGNEEEVMTHLLTLSNGLSHMSKAVVISHGAERLKNGMPVGVAEIASFEEVEGSDYVRVESKSGELLSVGMKCGIPMAGFPFTTIIPKKVLI
ncbi:MAG: tRNA pseudouridine(55) synthase TruB [Nitrospinae bacterium]|nr:tRNA pseudouridine(55) synthase TruB [Nitrospinota bacterium]